MMITAAYYNITPGNTSAGVASDGNTASHHWTGDSTGHWRYQYGEREYADTGEPGYFIPG